MTFRIVFTLRFCLISAVTTSGKTLKLARLSATPNARYRLISGKDTLSKLYGEVDRGLPQKREWSMPDSTSDSVSLLVDAVFRLNGSLIQAGDQLAQPAGISAAQWQVLGYLKRQ